MPRLRRSARARRRERPKLDAGIWKWLQSGRPYIDPHGISDQHLFWSHFLLSGEPVHWHARWTWETDHVGLFWDLVEAKVERGGIEVVDYYLHRAGDAPLVTEEEARRAAGQIWG